MAEEEEDEEEEEEDRGDGDVGDRPGRTLTAPGIRGPAPGRRWVGFMARLACATQKNNSKTPLKHSTYSRTKTQLTAHYRSSALQKGF